MKPEIRYVVVYKKFGKVTIPFVIEETFPSPASQFDGYYTSGTGRLYDSLDSLHKTREAAEQEREEILKEYNLQSLNNAK